MAHRMMIAWQYHVQRWAYHPASVQSFRTLQELVLQLSLILLLPLRVYLTPFTILILFPQVVVGPVVEFFHQQISPDGSSPSERKQSASSRR
jgi:hypothetical protein